MIPVDQEVNTHNEGADQWGDCMRACVASLLEINLHDVPHFYQIAKHDKLKFWELIDDFLEGHGCVSLVEYPVTDEWRMEKNGSHHIIIGPSHCGDGSTHAVVGLNGEIVHDPHILKEGLAGDRSDWMFVYFLRLVNL